MAIKKKTASKDASISLEIRGKNGTNIVASIDVNTTDEDLVDQLERANPGDLEQVLQSITMSVRDFEYLNVSFSK